MCIIFCSIRLHLKKLHVFILERGIFMTKTTDRLKRQDVPAEQTWDITDLFADNEAWEHELESIQNDVQQVVSFATKLHTNGETLYEALKTLEQYQQHMIHIATYATLQISTDGTKSEHQGRMAQVSAVLAKIGAKLSFFESELLEIPKITLDQFFDDVPDLHVYQKMLNDIMKKKPNIRSEEHTSE